MKTIIYIILAFLSLAILSDMTTDYSCKLEYMLPPIFMILICITQLVKIGIQWLERDAASYYQNKYESNITTIYGGNSVYHGRGYHTAKYTKKTTLYVDDLKEASSKCERDCVIQLNKKDT